MGGGRHIVALVAKELLWLCSGPMLLVFREVLGSDGACSDSHGGDPSLGGGGCETLKTQDQSNSNVFLPRAERRGKILVVSKMFCSNTDEICTNASRNVILV